MTRHCFGVVTCLDVFIPLDVELDDPLGLFRATGTVIIFAYVTSPKKPAAYKSKFARDICYWSMQECGSSSVGWAPMGDFGSFSLAG